MSENRYDDKLREGNQKILKLVPSNHVLRFIQALEIKNSNKKQIY